MKRYIFHFLLFILFIIISSSVIAGETLAEEEMIGECHDLLAACDENGHSALETDFGDFMADAMCRISGADIALLPSGDIGNHLQKGQVYMSDLQFCLMNDSMLYMGEMTSSQLHEVLEASIWDYSLADDMTVDWSVSETDGFLQVSGITVSYDLCAPEGEKIISLTDSEGSKIDPSETGITYTVISTGEVFNSILGDSAGEMIVPVSTETEIASLFIKASGSIQKPENTARITLLGIRPAILANGRFTGAIILLVGFLIFGLFSQFRKRSGNGTDDRYHYRK